jgi:hypothetical protein
MEGTMADQTTLTDDEIVTKVPTDQFPRAATDDADTSDEGDDTGDDSGDTTDTTDTGDDSGDDAA